MKIAHGTPFTVIDTGGGDLNWDGFSENRPVILNPAILGSTISGVGFSSVLTRDAFRRATPTEAGYEQMVGRNTFYKDTVKNLDLGLTKYLGMPIDHKLMVRLNMFNALNRREWSFPTVDFASTNFGRITGQFNSPRTLQIEARFIF